MIAHPVAMMIKDSTESLHQDVEALLRPKLATLQNRDEYATLLRMFYGYYSPLEDLVQEFVTPALLPDVAERRKADAILQDLHSLQGAVNGLAFCQELPSIENKAQAMGALYVLEGSTLGGKMIAKMLRQNKSLALTDNELTFFLGDKEETGSKWKAFIQVLNQQPCAEQTIAAANQTFYHLKNWMQHFYHG